METDPVLLAIAKVRAKQIKERDDKINSDRAHVTQVIQKLLSDAKIDFEGIRQDILKQINDSSFSTDKVHYEKYIHIDISCLYNSSPVRELYIVSEGKLCLYFFTKHSKNNNGLKEYLESIPPVAHLLRQLKHEFPGGNVAFYIHIDGRSQTMTFKIDYVQTPLPPPTIYE